MKRQASIAGLWVLASAMLSWGTIASAQPAAGPPAAAEQKTAEPVAEEPADSEPKATLHWVNEDTLPGTLKGANDQHIIWGSDVFQQPVSVDYKVLKMIDFVPPETVNFPKEDFRADLATGDVLFGKLLDLTADEIVLLGKRTGEVRVNRKFVRSSSILCIRNNRCFRRCATDLRHSASCIL